MICLSRLIKSSQITLGDEFTLEYKRPILIQDPEEDGESIDWEQQIKEEIMAKAQLEADQWLAQQQLLWGQERQQWEEEMARQHDLQLKQGYEQGISQGYNDGYRQGKEEGYLQSKEENQQVGEELITLLQRIDGKKNQLIEQHIVELKDLALDIAEKVIWQKIADDQYIYLRMIQEGLESFRQYQWVDVYVSEEEVGLDSYIYSRLIDEFAKESKVLKVRGKGELPLGSCIIETDEGVVDVSIGTQLSSLTEELDLAPMDANFFDWSEEE